MSYQSNREDYVRRIRAYLAGATAVGDFCAEFMAQWRRDRDEELAIASSWPRRFDLELLAAQRDGKLSIEEMNAAWTELWGYAGQEFLHAMVDRVFAACDALEENASGPYEITEEVFREEVTKALGEYDLDEGKKRRG